MLRFHPVSRSVCFSVLIYRARLLTFVQTVFAIIISFVLFYFTRRWPRLFIFFNLTLIPPTPSAIFNSISQWLAARVRVWRTIVFFYSIFSSFSREVFFLLYFFPLLCKHYIVRQVNVIYLRRSAPSNVCGILFTKKYICVFPGTDNSVSYICTANPPRTLRIYIYGRTCDCTLRCHSIFKNTHCVLSLN